jgi:hypothetical protein
MGFYHSSGGALDSKTAHPPSMAARTFCRQTPKVGAVCLNWARKALCGGARSNPRPPQSRTGPWGELAGRKLLLRPPDCPPSIRYSWYYNVVLMGGDHGTERSRHACERSSFYKPS